MLDAAPFLALFLLALATAIARVVAWLSPAFAAAFHAATPAWIGPAEAEGLILLIGLLPFGFYHLMFSTTDKARLTRALGGARFVRLFVHTAVGIALVWALLLWARLLTAGVDALAASIAHALGHGNVVAEAAYRQGFDPLLNRVHGYAAVGVYLLFAIPLAVILYDWFRVARSVLRVGIEVVQIADATLDTAEVSAPYAPETLAGGDAVDVLLASDLHIAATGERTIEGSLADDETFSLLRGAVRRHSPRAIILGGDITDTGHVSAWKKARTLFRELGVPVFAAPGNHDFHFRRLNERAYGRWETLWRAHDPDQGGVLARSFGEEKVASAVTSLARSGRRPKKLFPILCQPKEIPLDILLLNSNRWQTDSPASNAVGLVGKEQLDRAAALLTKRRAKRPFVIVLHHHIFGVEPFLTCVDAPAVLAFAKEHGAQAMIHGHKHMPYVRDVKVGEGILRVISLGSSLYPAKGPCGDEVVTPSLMGIRLTADGHIASLSLIRAAEAPFRSTESKP